MPKSSSKQRQSNHLPWVISGLVLLGLLLSYFLFPSVQEFFDNTWQVFISKDQEQLREWVDGFGWYGPLVLVIAMTLQMFLVVLPSWLLMVISVQAYGSFWGSVISYVAIFCASSVGYAVGKKLSRYTIYRLLGEQKEKRLENLVEAYGIWVVVIVRMAPFLSNDAISFVGGLVNMGYWRFIGATLLGITPLILLMAWLGENNDRLQTGLLWGTLASLVGFGVYVYWKRSR